MGIGGILLAGLVGMQTFSNYAGRAEQHRVAGVKYKMIIRELEQELAKLDVKYLFSWDVIPGNDNVRFIKFLEKRYGIDWIKPENGILDIYGNNIEKLDARRLNDLRKRLDELEIEAPVVPEEIYNDIEKKYEDCVFFVKTVEELSRSDQCPT